MTEPQSLPTRFPCWVRATYSWGGESKRDLGFVEGDLIECLNAGDGSWWMGRLRRDKRMMGLFPSNFVQVLDDSFQPASRATSPMPEKSPSTSPFNNPHVPQKKSKTFRKPFTAYAAPDARIARRTELQKQESSASRGPSPAPRASQRRHAGSVSRAPSPRPHRGSVSRAPSPRPHRGSVSRAQSPQPPRRGYGSYSSRAPSPAPPVHNGYGSRAPSPAPPPHGSYGSRGPSPASSFQTNYHRYARAASPQPGLDVDEPPPPPPPHRTAYTSRGHRPNGHHTPLTPRPVSPAPPSPGGGSGLTPSPLRTAMDDVMSSLEGMGMSRNNASPAPSPPPPLDPWSPEAFDQTYAKSKRTNHARPNTAMGLGISDSCQDRDELHMGGSSNSRYENNPPQLSNYVQRMESRLQKMHANAPERAYDDDDDDDDDAGPAVPPKSSMPNLYDRPKSSMSGSVQMDQKLRHRKSAYEVGKSMLGRTFTTKTNSTSASSGNRSTTTNGSASTQMTDKSIMSGPSASGFSATSAGEYARKKMDQQGRFRANSAFGARRDVFERGHVSTLDFSRPETPLTGISYHSSHASDRLPPRAQSQVGWNDSGIESGGSGLGGLMAPKPKKSGFFKKIMETAKTGAANARSTIASGEPRAISPTKLGDGISSIGGGYSHHHTQSTPASVGMGGGTLGTDWVQVRRDVNRSNSLSRIERVERRERCQMMDYPALSPVEELYEQCDGDEGADGNPVAEPTNFLAVNLSLVDKNARFVNGLPPMTNAVSLATGFVCRPYRSDVQRLRAIFTWVSEKITWDEDFDGEVDSRRVIQTKRGCAEEVAVLVLELCAAVGIHCEVIHGYLKSPGELPELGIMPRPNHWWNAVIVDGEWRIMDCALAAPSNPRRGLYSSAGGQAAESWWFLSRPMEICWTHIPEKPHQQHLCPPIAPEILLALPCACPPFFKNYLEMVDYDTSLVRIDDLEMVHVKFTVPEDVEVAAMVEAKAFERDADGDSYESGETVRKRALAQAEWLGGQKRYTVKALLPGDEGQGVLKIYAGKRGLMHSIKDIPHPVAFVLPIIHTGDNPHYNFVARHPTPHATRHDLYLAQPQCERLAINNTYVFAIRQHPASLSVSSPNPGGNSPIPFMRPSSAMSFSASSVSGSDPSTTNAYASKKPAKLAIQSPSNKIHRLMRKEEKVGGTTSTSMAAEKGDGGTWETIIKCSERGLWRGLVLADRSARWCVFAEWTCV